MILRRPSSPRDMFLEPIPALARPGIRLFLTSAALLFVELFLIRWIPANVVYVGFFSNFLLMGSFLGIGAGILLGRGGRRLPFSPFALLFFAVIKIVTLAQLNVQIGSADDIYFGIADVEQKADVNLLVLPLAVVLTTLVMAALALPLGGLLRSMPPLRAYAIDIAGSMAGIALFLLFAALGTGPLAWTLVVAFFASALALGSGLTGWSILSAFALAATVFVGASDRDTWSPYQRITVFETIDSVALNVNGIPHQGFHKEPGRYGIFYQQIDWWLPERTFDRVLVVGAGTGNDTAAALERGAAHVDAVEIDPKILGIGQRLHPARPYDDPRVATHVDDGRGFLTRSTAQYDLIVFALPDSLTLVSTTANLRLESFLFTEQAIQSVREHLAPDGIFVLYNYYRQPWLVERLGGMLKETFGSEPILRTYEGVTGSAAVLAAGPGIAALPGGRPPGDRVDALDLSNPPEPATDDWPFPYLREPSIAPYYVVALALVLLFAGVLVVGAARASAIPVRRFSPHFFVLGIAFLLLETRSLVTFSLLFGNTWTVNALVFFAILASVLAAIAVNARFRIRDHRPLYLALFAAIAVAWALPPASLLLDPPWLRYVIAAVLAFAPVFFANLVFTRSFRDTRTADMAFASNLLGAMVGGAVEYIALITGYQALLLVVAALYGAAYLLATRGRVLADRDLEVEVQQPGRPQVVGEGA